MQEDQIQLKRIHIAGFKSFPQSGTTVELNSINVMIGVNGSGKSNLVAFFRMLSHMMTEHLFEYIGIEEGGASDVLHYGSKTTRDISFDLHFENTDGTKTSRYSARMTHATPDNLFITSETVAFHDKNQHDKPYEKALEVQGKESVLKTTGVHDTACRVLYNCIIRQKVFHFHDTGSHANVKTHALIDDDSYFREDGGNAAAFLLRMKDEYPEYYERLVRHIQNVVYNFKDFVLEPTGRNQQKVMLKWQDTSGHQFGPHQLSDGSLRFILLSIVFLQPPELLPT